MPACYDSRRPARDGVIDGMDWHCSTTSNQALRSSTTSVRVLSKTAINFVERRCKKEQVLIVFLVNYQTYLGYEFSKTPDLFTVMPKIRRRPPGRYFSDLSRSASGA
jgi:hypothetical protein